MKRLQKLLIDIDWFTMQCTYYDDETGEAVIDATEEDCYNAIIAEDEHLKFLTEKVIRFYINMAFTDWKMFSIMQNEFDAHA